MIADLATKAPISYVQDIRDSGTGFYAGAHNIAIGYLSHVPFTNPAENISISENEYLAKVFLSLHDTKPYFHISKYLMPNHTFFKFSEAALENSLVVFNLGDYYNSKEKIETERINRLNIEISETIKTRASKDEELLKFINFRAQDQSLSKIVNFISRLSPKTYNIEITQDYSIYFTLMFSDTTLFLEFFLEKSESEPDFVFLVYSNGNCIANGEGDVDNVSNKLSSIFRAR